MKDSPFLYAKLKISGYFIVKKDMNLTMSKKTMSMLNKVEVRACTHQMTIETRSLHAIVLALTLTR